MLTLQEATNVKVCGSSTATCSSSLIQLHWLDNVTDVDTLEETPIDGLFLENITVEGSCGQSFRCESLLKTDVGPSTHMKLFATGHSTDVKINSDIGTGTCKQEVTMR